MEENFHEQTNSVFLVDNSSTTAVSAGNHNETENIILANKPDRNLDTILAASLSVIDLYLVLCNLTYYFKFNQPVMSWTNRICCICAFALLSETCWYQSEIQLQSRVTDGFCRLYTIVNVVLSIGNKTLVYVVLWIRQRSFYKTCSIFNISKRKFDCISWILLAGILTFSGLQILTLSSIPHKRGKYGCVAATPTEFIQVATPIVFIAGSLFQSFLLGPVLYPLYKHLQERKNNAPYASVEKVVKRLSLCSTICIVTDIMFISVSVQKPGEGFSYSFIPICYSINMIINLSALLMSFADFRARFFPFKVAQGNTTAFSRVTTKTQVIVTVVK